MKRFIYHLAKSWIGSMLLHWIFAHFSCLVPGETLILNDSLLAFFHPSPSYPLHILLVPREKIGKLDGLPTSDGTFEQALFDAVKDLVNQFDLEEKGYRLIVNGGDYQEVKHLHFHLVSGENAL